MENSVAPFKIIGLSGQEVPHIHSQTLLDSTKTILQQSATAVSWQHFIRELFNVVHNQNGLSNVYNFCITFQQNFQQGLCTSLFYLHDSPALRYLFEH